ncbi:MAG: phosphoglycerate dehydrogenase [Chloroflexota bacterium]
MSEGFQGVGKVLIASSHFARISSKAKGILAASGLEIVERGHLAPFTEASLVEHVGSAGAVILGAGEFTGAVMDAAPLLRIIARHGVGHEGVDVAGATRRGVMVTNTPSANDNAVADLAVGLMLASARHIPFATERTRAGGWPVVLGTELWDKIVGIVGLGKIGKAVARRLSGFDVTILAHTNRPDEDFGRRYGIRYVGLDELLGLSDFVTLHVPLSERTLGLIGAPQLARMKSTAHLVNTSRGRVIDEVALVAALTEGRIAGAALDVFETEPSRRPELLSLENVIPTPHMGASTVEALERMSLMAAEDVVLALKGQRPRHLVNGEVLSLGAG